MYNGAGMAGNCVVLEVLEAHVSESVEKPQISLWFGEFRCTKVLTKLRLSCGLGGSYVRIC